ncbi:MAG: hypothetical protein AB7E85_03990 [Pseudobdellovibrionaceae bacterium]
MKALWDSLVDFVSETTGYKHLDLGASLQDAFNQFGREAGLTQYSLSERKMTCE